MHGEFEPPGGRLAAVDLDVDEQGARIERIRIADDRWPGRAMIERALTGASAQLSEHDLEALVAERTPPTGADGYMPAAVAVAVRRALAHATDWRDHRWRLVRTDPLPPLVHLALDEVLTRALAAGRIGPTLRIWNWRESAVVIGSFQSVRNEVDIGQARRHGVQIVRRISGGGTMFMQGTNVITWSMSAPPSLVAGMSFAHSYAFLDAWAVAALRDLGIDARYQGLNDIASPRGKIAGAAQKRLAGGTVLHHVTMSYDIDTPAMMDVLRLGRERVSDKGTTSAQKSVDPLRTQTDLTREQVVAHMLDVFRSRHGLVEEPLDPALFAEARDLAATKFATDEWLQRVP